jgi:lipopolysaccharide transport system ATP-binding protein
MSTVISVEQISKVYRLGMIGGGTLGEDLTRWWAKVRDKPDPSLKVAGEYHPRRIGEQFWALEDVSFDVKEGEVLGMVGRNGAGKSTLLKILSQVTAPSSGQIRFRGRIASLLEVGTGFHPELTGCENIFLNGAILGMTKAEIRAKLDEIVAFSECEAFIDTPVKRYSSGMYVRLAFAVAAHLEPEILIVDEVLSVGDAQFQRKCLGKMGDVSRDGRTILFVSHSAAAVSSLCTRALLLQDGRVALHGDVSQVMAAYQVDPLPSTTAHSVADLPRRGTGEAKFVALEIISMNGDGAPLPVAVPGGDVLVRVTIDCAVAFEAAHVGLEFYDRNGYRVVDAILATKGDSLTMEPEQRAVVTFRLHELLLKPESYRLNLRLGRHGLEYIDYVEFAGRLEVHEDIAVTRYSETFPGVYQAHFSYVIDVRHNDSW